MNRRNFFKTSSQVAVGAVVASKFNIQNAFAAEGEAVLIESEISRNHGHILKLDVADVIKLLRKNQSSNDVLGIEVISIQGESGHPHDISLSVEHLMGLLLGEELSLESSLVAGHAHTVLITMSLV
jgi:hypothetical protein